MQELLVTEVIPREKGRTSIRFDNGMEVLLYKGEVRKLGLQEQTVISREKYDEIIYEILGTRAKKRAMFLLEQMDRTEHQLRDKLMQNGYPAVCVDLAIDYVKKYHYIDDLRYATNYISYQQKRKSRQKLKIDLLTKGIDKNVIEQALDEAFDSDEQIKIRQLLEKKHYDPKECDRKEKQKTYQYLMRRGFKGSDILHVMKIWDGYEE
ncbi:regulatory protein RecX [Roseburia sp. AM23-20]|jgi:regulatory protein|uniref:regulatory protein RecX n=1 Tax=Roseburia sp. AM23-20 TaxID=2292066 RepID=UPI000E49807B|nr:regulatory protein RecX [Roseburia sp. AM23-20]RHF97431.1 regulatory protein RecX [Roseburia sp. AM23-20]